jgi:hypothetical protein
VAGLSAGGFGGKAIADALQTLDQLSARQVLEVGLGALRALDTSCSRARVVSVAKPKSS